MARLRQQNSGNYGSSSNISAEFENVVRYLNRAELGDKTLGELMSSIFDEDGDFAGPIELRLDATSGLQYRVGTYTDAEKGWTTIAQLADLRGSAGANVGTLGSPLVYNRQDYVATAGQTDFTYAFDTTDDLLVYVNGILMTPTTDYTSNPATDTVTFIAGRNLNDAVSIYSIRAAQISGYKRVDTVTTGNQTVFPFVHSDADQLQVYKNGILMREGGAYDYTHDPATDTVTFTTNVPADNTVSILTVENTSAQTVTGLLMEADFCDLTTGLILFSKIAVSDGQIPQAKISGLVAALADAGYLTVSDMTPTGDWLTTGRMWLDTSKSPNVLKFYDGVSWLSTSPESSLPAFSGADASKYVRLNSQGTGFIYDTIDLSSVIAITQKGAANGVATLDATGRLPTSQLPASIGAETYYNKQVGAVANGDVVMKRIYRQRVQLTGISLQCSAGTATVQVQVNGVDIGQTYNVTSAGLEAVFAQAQQIDASASNQRIGYTVTNQAGLADLEVSLAAEVLA